MTKEFKEDNPWYTASNTKSGMLPVVCPKCKILLTTLELNNKCVIDARIECSRCGMICEANNLWAEVVGKV